jgi:hypothetical protein
MLKLGGHTKELILLELDKIHPNRYVLFHVAVGGFKSKRPT